MTAHETAQCVNTGNRGVLRPSLMRHRHKLSVSEDIEGHGGIHYCSDEFIKRPTLIHSVEVQFLFTNYNFE